MIVIDEDLKAEMRSATRCPCCLRRTPYGCDVHHVIPSGLGGEITVRWNVLSLARECHTAHHAGSRPKRDYLLRLVAIREGTTPDAIEELVQRLRRMPSEAELCRDCNGHGGRMALGKRLDVCPACAGHGAIIDGQVILSHRVRESV